jgi:hypothetical protein
MSPEMIFLLNWRFFVTCSFEEKKLFVKQITTESRDFAGFIQDFIFMFNNYLINYSYLGTFQKVNTFQKSKNTSNQNHNERCILCGI